jgi:hypothetical protein
MKKIGIMLILTGVFIIANNPSSLYGPWSNSTRNSASAAQFGERKTVEDTVDERNYRYPSFYRGLYLTVNSANNIEKLKQFVAKARGAGLNTLVMDVQMGKNVKCMVPASNVRYCIDSGIHPVARIVVFPDGLRKYPVSESYMEERLATAEDSCKNGFREIQFDYIRFHDSGTTRHLTYAQRYKFIEDFITSARIRVKRYHARIAADVFGRIPLNRDDIIGQKIESLDRVVDMICPMAYPSHYTWSRKFYADPYFTVRETSTRAKQRSKNAMIVAYIQAFKMKMSGIPFDRYLLDQLKAVHDAGITGFIMWNARQEYDVPLAAVKNFYSNRISSKDATDRTPVN